MTLDEFENLTTRDFMRANKPPRWDSVRSEIQRLQAEQDKMAGVMEKKAFEIRDEILRLADLEENEDRRDDIRYELSDFMNSLAYNLYPDQGQVYSSEYMDHEDVTSFWIPSTC